MICARVTFFLFDNFEIIRSFSSNCIKYETPLRSGRPGEPVFVIGQRKNIHSIKLLPLTLYSQSRRSWNLCVFGGFETASGWKEAIKSTRLTPIIGS